MLLRAVNMSCAISIHALLAESDGGSGVGSWRLAIFLSTLSLRRATWLRCWKLAACDISIHALLAESDFRHCTTYLNCSRFLSTLSLRRATVTRVARTPTTVISIHALLAESDQTANGLADAPPQISIHALLAESDVNSISLIKHIGGFLSTLSLRRATLKEQEVRCKLLISIHALLAESDR